MANIDRELLIKKAIEARERSYSPYSNFSVGAALLCADGTIFMGANIESASYSPTSCAERVAFFSAVFAGKRDFLAIAVVGGKSGEEISEFCAPCGVCRQVMSEFGKDDFEIILFDGKDEKVFTLNEFLPLRFSL